MDHSTTPEIRADKRPLITGGQRQTFLWLAILLLLLGGAGLHMLYRHELHQLQQQLVATQHSFAGLSEESVQHLQRLEERTADWAAMQSRLLGISVQLGSLQQQLNGFVETSSVWQTLETTQTGQAKQLQMLSQQLAGQSTAIEEAALALDAQQQRLQERFDKQDAIATAQLASLSVLIEELKKQLDGQQEQLHEDGQQLHALSEQLVAWQLQLDRQVQAGERFGQLQESLLKLAQQVENGREEREQLGKEMSAFRLQMTRAQNSLREQMDALRN